MSKAEFEKTLGNVASNLRHVSTWIGREELNPRIRQFLSRSQTALSETEGYPMSQHNPIRLQIKKLNTLLDEVVQAQPLREKRAGEMVLYLSVRFNNLAKLVTASPLE